METSLTGSLPAASRARAGWCVASGSSAGPSGTPLLQEHSSFPKAAERELESQTRQGSDNVEEDQFEIPYHKQCDSWLEMV